MSSILRKLNDRLRPISENFATTTSEWKDPNSPSYDRQYAEDALYHTIGPLTDTPRWVNSWTSPSDPVPEFSPGGPAPQWTPEELVMAFAGDPSLLFKGTDNPRSPRYGNKGGSPLYRTAKKVSKYYARSSDPSFLEDMYSNGFIALLRMMQPGQDRSQSAFIPFAIRNVQSAMEHGIGGEVRTSAASGYDAEVTFGSKKDFEQGVGIKIAVRGLKSLLDEVNPGKLRKAASVVKGTYREKQSHDKTPDNPFGYFSAPYYQVINQYADALQSGNEEAISASRQQIIDLIEKIDQYSTKIGGASTGLGQAIDTPDRKTSIGIASMDAPASQGEDDTGSMAANIPGRSHDPDEVNLEGEPIFFVLEKALYTDLGKVLASSEKYRAMATALGSKGGKIGGPLSANEFRYILRSLGPIGGHRYPGKGTPRANTKIERDGRDWWKPGEDPEIEPLPVTSESAGAINGGLWHSIWARSGYEAMGPTAIAIEMTKEVQEFQHYGIPTARKVKQKGKNAEAVSKVSVGNTYKAAQIKLTILADIYKDRIDESLIRGTMIAEDLKTMDKIDRSILAETAEGIVHIINKRLAEDSPPGWKGTVKAMKKHKDIDNPYALAWSMKKKGYKSHYKDDDSGKKKTSAESMMKPVEAIYFDE